MSVTTKKKRKLRKPTRNGRVVRFEDFSYPLPAPDLEWKCRNAIVSLDRSDYMVIASILDAYFAMVANDTQKKRNYVCGEMRKIIDAGDWY